MGYSNQPTYFGKDKKKANACFQVLKHPTFHPSKLHRNISTHSCNTYSIRCGADVEKKGGERKISVMADPSRCLTDLLPVLCSLNMTYGQEPNIIRCVMQSTSREGPGFTSSLTADRKNVRSKGAV